MKKRIGISFSPLQLHNYYGWFTRFGVQIEVELTDLSFERHNIHEFDHCDAFILTGGDDIDPAFYGGEPVYDNMPESFHSHRDVFEKMIFEHAMENNKPVLGICRGMQLVNVILGGKLIQDQAHAGNKLHRSENGKDKIHEVHIVENTLLYQINNGPTGYTNSAHHQAADPQCVGHNLMVNAVAGDGITIEGLEFKDKTGKPFLLCVQWHPERIQEAHEQLSANILNSFLKAIPTLKPNQYADH